MSPENRSPNVRRRDVRMDGLNADRATRSLGRGLEEVSHLFLPATPAIGPDAQAEDRTPEREEARPAARAGVAVLRRSAALAKNQLVATLLECQDALENGMRALGSAVSCSPYGEIDLLALDSLNQLTVIDVDTTPGNELLLRGISHVDWVVRNVPNLRRMYQKCEIDAPQQPRLLLVAPAFSPMLRSAIRQLTRPMVTCFKYHAVAIFDGTGIVLEQLRDDYD